MFASCFYALTLHTQPVLFPSVLLFVLWILFYRKRKWKRAVIDIFLFGSVLFVLLVPWTVRNYIVFKQITPMRACLGREGEIVNSIKIKFERNKVMTQNVFAHNKIGFYTYIENKRMMIDCFVDDSYFLTIGTRQEPDSLFPYFGLVFNGDEAHYIKSFSASLRQITGNDTVDTPVVQSGKSMGAFTATDQIFLEDAKILVKKSDEKWNNRIVFNTSNKTNFYEIVFPNDISPVNVRRVGVLFSLDKADLSTNGYMVWLHPWLEPDLWIFKDGMPSNSVYIKKIVKGQNQSGFSSIVQLVVNHPVEFFRDHFIPEFFKFWSPYIDRIFTTSNEPSLQIQVVSFISLLPLLIFAPIGLFRQKNINIIILILIPVLTTSIGYSIFETQVRYRLVLDGFLILLAIPGFECFLQLFRKNFRD